jgi:hypothetical protein
LAEIGRRDGSLAELCCKSLQQQVPSRIAEEIFAQLPIPDPPSSKHAPDFALIDRKIPRGLLQEGRGIQGSSGLLEACLQPRDFLEEQLSR